MAQQIITRPASLSASAKLIPNIFQWAGWCRLVGEYQWATIMWGAETLDWGLRPVTERFIEILAMKGWIWNGILSDCNPSESLLAMDLISATGHWVTLTEGVSWSQEKVPHCHHRAPNQWVRAKTPVSRSLLLISWCLDNGLQTTHTPLQWIATLQQLTLLCTKHSSATPPCKPSSNQGPAVKCGNHNFMDC